MLCQKCGSKWYSIRKREYGVANCPDGTHDENASLVYIVCANCGGESDYIESDCLNDHPEETAPTKCISCGSTKIAIHDEYAAMCSDCFSKGAFF